MFTGVTPGWVSPGLADTTAEDIEAHLETILATDGFAVPTTIFEEIDDVVTRIERE